ncbi:MAG: hypothetical protein JST93_29160 [Acidobacteria bacterium]|nr:hypothetical protein [Acidobacteriota bacterium]
MRTTLDLTDEAYHLAKAVSRERDLSLGKTISQLILERLSTPARPTPVIEFENGMPVVTIGRSIGAEDVRAILEEAE